MPSDETLTSAAASLHRLLEAIEVGEVAATDEQRRRLEGALVALTELVGTDGSGVSPVGTPPT